MAHSRILFLELLCSSAFVLVYSTTPPKMAAPTISAIKHTSFTATFSSVVASSYIITATPRHALTDAKTVSTTSTSVQVTGLLSDTIYDVSVKGVSSTGEAGPEGDTTPAYTLPAQPITRTSTPTPNSMFLYGSVGNAARVEQWTFQYKVNGSSNVPNITTTNDGEFYAVELTGLQPYTVYQIRTRASVINGSSVAEEDSPFGDWITVTTEYAQVYARVDVVDETYSSALANKASPEFIAIIDNIKAAYAGSSVSSSILGIEGVEIIDNGGIPRVHYQLQLSDTTGPFNITSTGEFGNFAINNGDDPAGQPIAEQADTFTYSFYYSDGPVCPANPKRSILISGENSATAEAELEEGVAGGATVTLDQDKVIGESGHLLSLDSNTVYGIGYKYFVLDCSEQSGESLYFLTYTASTDSAGLNPFSNFFITTDLSSDDINIDAIRYESSDDGTSVTLIVPSVDKAVEYQVLNASGVVATLANDDIDGSSEMKINLLNLDPGSNNTFTIKVTVKKLNGATSSAISRNISVTPGCEFAIVKSTILKENCTMNFTVKGIVTMEITQSIASPAACEDITANERHIEVNVNAPSTAIERVIPGNAYLAQLFYVVTGRQIWAENLTFETESDFGPSPDFTSVTNASIVAYWSKPYNGTEYRATIHNADDGYFRSINTTNSQVLFDGLQPGLLYEICITTSLCQELAKNATQCGKSWTAPASVTGINVTAFYTVANTTWEPVRGSANYTVTITSLSGAGRIEIVITNETTIHLTGLSSGEEYELSVVAKNPAGSGEILRKIFVTKALLPVTTPSVTTTGYSTPGNTAATPDSPISAQFGRPTESTSVALTDGVVTTTTIGPAHNGSFPWWIIALIGFLIIVAIAVGLFLYIRKRQNKFVINVQPVERQTNDIHNRNATGNGVVHTKV